MTRFKTWSCLALLALLSACATSQPVAVIDQSQEAEQYQAHAARTYAPPGPPEDPWGPYITEAASRFDVPDVWIRAVMRVESGGRLYEGGGLITSPVGAMGLMQVMPETYDGLRERYALSDDAYDPYNNIMAGTAYIREMYDIYGSPAFLAAYNCGPARLDDYLANRRALPDETRHYIAKAGPNVIGVFPGRRSPADDVAYNQLPLEIPTGLRYARVVVHSETRVAQVRHGNSQVATRAQRNEGHNEPRGERPVEVAQLPEPPRPAHGEPRTQSVLAQSHALHLITPAMADTLPAKHGNAPGGGNWAIQVGAFGNEGDAKHAADSARGEAKASLAQAHSLVGTVQKAHSTMYRARLTGLSRESAIQACEKLTKGRTSCIVLSPDAQL